MILKIGHRVTFLHEKGEGEIKEIKNGKALVIDEQGFERWYFVRDLAFIHSVDYQIGAINHKEVDVASKAKNTQPKRLSVKSTNKQVLEIDLHIEKLIDSTRGMSNSEILLKQLTEFRAVFSRAKAKSVSKLIVVHGVGEGVLKNEIRIFLSRQEHIDFYDADYREYGKGATEIEFLKH